MPGIPFVVKPSGRLEKVLSKSDKNVTKRDMADEALMLCGPEVPAIRRLPI
jgi:hypothetical protein